MNTKFCNGSAFKIANAGLKDKVRKECELLLGVSIHKDYFPGPQPVTVEVKDFEKLRSEKYMVCEKSDGERYVMMLINVDNKPMCFITNRNNELYFITASFKKEVFEGSIFDGELIQTKAGEWNYVIHDCFCYNRTSFMESPHNLRYACIIDFIVKRYVNKETDCFNIKTKLFYHFGPKLSETWAHIQKTTENEIDGLIFTPLNRPIVFGRDYSLLKWKTEHTMDLLVVFGEDELLFYGTKNFLFRKINKETESYNNVMELDNSSFGNNDVIIEFNYIHETDTFIPYRIRCDKDKPNSEITIKNTLKNIKEAIQITDFDLSYLSFDKLSIS